MVFYVNFDGHFPRAFVRQSSQRCFDSLLQTGFQKDRNEEKLPEYEIIAILRTRTFCRCFVCFCCCCCSCLIVVVVFDVLFLAVIAVVDVV